MSDYLVRVVSLRSLGKPPLGGAIFVAKEIGVDGHVKNPSEYLVVKAGGTVLGGAAVQPGQWWSVTGDAETRTLKVDGFAIRELQIEASQAQLKLPSGEHVVDFLATNPDFKGMGRVKARRLWESLGQELYGVLDSGDVAKLQAHVSQEMAEQLVQGWKKLGVSQVLQWLQTRGVEVQIGRKVVEYFGDSAPAEIAKDPYRLLSFAASWDEVDALARDAFDVARDDERRLQASVEEACYRLFSQGHTRAEPGKVKSIIEPLLSAGQPAQSRDDLAQRAMEIGRTNGSYVWRAYGLQPLGALVLETEVAQAVATRIQINEPLLDEDEVDELLLKFEREEGLEFNGGQWSAVQLTAKHAVAVIVGGAGVGKTTVLKALHLVYERAGIQVTQLALTGRAAKRISEATGKPAFTIAGFLNRPVDADGGCGGVVILDEASMVDLTIMARLLQRVPADSRLVFVGDTGQLMPIGPGLVLHALVQVAAVPRVELEAPHRFGTEISIAAKTVRGGIWPCLDSDTASPIAFVPAETGRQSERGISETVLHLFRDDPQNTQILCATKNGLAGTEHLNSLCQAVMTAEARALTTSSEEYGSVVHTGFHLGDRIVCTRNLWGRGLQNGSIGELVTIEDKPRDASECDVGLSIGPVIAWIEWDDGQKRPVDEALLDDLALAYAITVHKAQGSQWQRVVIPIPDTRSIDRTMVYTAMTRAQKQVVFVGDEAAAIRAVEKTPRVALRDVALDLILADEATAAKA